MFGVLSLPGQANGPGETMANRSFVRTASGLASEWLARRPRRSLVIGCCLLALAVLATALPPHSVVLALLFGVAAVYVLFRAIRGMSMLGWLPMTVLFAAVWTGAASGVWLGQAVVQLAGHDESCSYVSSTDSQNDHGYTTTNWVVRCPDGQQSFTADKYADITDANAPIRVRSAGPLFTALPETRAHDYSLWFVALPGIALLVGSLIMVLRRAPRRPGERP